MVSMSREEFHKKYHYTSMLFAGCDGGDRKLHTEPKFKGLKCDTNGTVSKE